MKKFGDLSRRQGLPQKEPEGSLKECIDAAILVVDTVNGFIEEGKMCKAFWFTHYISFCAIATLYVYTIQQSISPEQNNNARDYDHSRHSESAISHPSMQHFEAAEKCQRSIAETTAKTSPFRRYNIILNKLKSEVLQRLGLRSVGNSSAATFTNGQSMHGETTIYNLMDLPGRTPSRTPSSVTYPLDFGIIRSYSFHLQNRNALPSQDYSTSSPAVQFRSTRNIPEQVSDESLLDLDVFGPQGELMGWSEFDACVSIVISP